MNISKMVLGTMILKLDKLDYSFNILDEALARGINTFDTAKVYGDSEEVLGKWLELRKNRDKVVILTKGAHHNKFRKRVTSFDILSDVHDSLAALKTNYIDIYMLHRDDVSVPVDTIMATLNTLVNDGTIKAIGVSNWTTERIKRANEFAQKNGMKQIEFISPQFSVAKQVSNPWGDDDSDCIAADEEMIKYCENNGIKIIAFSSLARGFMSGAFKHNEKEKAKEILDRYAQKGYMHEENFDRLKRTEGLAAQKNATVAQIALAYNMSVSKNIHPIFTAINTQQLDENIKVADIKLTKAECDRLK